MLNLKIFAFGVFMVWRQLTKASITVLINNITATSLPYNEQYCV